MRRVRPIDADKIGLTDFEIFMCQGDFKAGLQMLLQKIDNAPTLDTVPLSVIADIRAEIDEQYDIEKRDNIYRAEGLEMADEIIEKHIGKEKT